MSNKPCPLCLNKNVHQIPKDKKYFFCNSCYLIHLDPIFRKDLESEKNRYLKHQNNIAQKDYVAFLLQIVNAALPFLNDKMKGLDFGCGPEPVLSQILKQKGLTCDNYDPIFHPIINKNYTYDFIFSTECFEHFYNPEKELNKLNNWLNVSGYLCIMTERWKDFIHFRDWYYKKDFTHVSFYHDNSFDFICEKYDFKIAFKDEKRIVILQKNPLHYKTKYLFELLNL